MTVVNRAPQDASAHEELTPSVSIVIPTHNRPEMVSRLLESLRRLAYRRDRFEVIVVGGDHDPGRQIVESFTESAGFPIKYSVVKDDVLRSASYKRNEGARLARGDILAFTDDDCVVHPEWVTMAVPLFCDPDVGGVEGAVEIPKPEKPTLTYRGSQRLSLRGGYQTCNMFFRKSVFEECGGFDTTFPYYLEDTDLAYTVIERGYRIPFGANAVISHPVQAGRPLKLLIMARVAEHIPYLFSKHAASRLRLRTAVRLLNRSHYAYLGLYTAAFVIGLVNPVAGVFAVGAGLAILIPAHLAHDFWGLHFTASELVLTGLCQPIVPVLRLCYWLKGLVEVQFRSWQHD